MHILSLNDKFYDEVIDMAFIFEAYVFSLLI